MILEIITMESCVYFWVFIESAFAVFYKAAAKSLYSLPFKKGIRPAILNHGIYKIDGLILSMP
jgi:hypothetical protein